MHIIKAKSIFASRAAKTESVLRLLQKASQFLQGTKIKSLLKSYKIRIGFYDCYKIPIDFCSMQNLSQFLQASYKNQVDF